MVKKYRLSNDLLNFLLLKNSSYLYQEFSKHPENLEIFIADLLEDEGWKEAVTGCDFVLHVASPFFLGEPDNEDVFVKPAVEGTLRVLEACSDSEVKKVVLTSSMAAVGYGHAKEKNIFSEEDWSKTDGEISAYAKSKTLAEKAAWNYLKDLPEDKKFKLTVINPVAVTGPMLTDDIGSSNDFLLKLINGSMPACPKIHMGYIDVRDVAKAHISAMTNEQTDGERILMPNFLVKFMAIFVKELKGLLPSLNRIGEVDKTKAKKFFDWKLVTTEESVIESAKQLKEMGLME